MVNESIFFKKNYHNNLRKKTSRRIKFGKKGGGEQLKPI